MLDDRFEITDVIARSGMASLFRANDRQTGRAVALKVPLFQIESDPAGFAGSSGRRRSASDWSILFLKFSRRKESGLTS